MNKQILNRIERLEYMIDKGYTCDINTGIVYGLKNEKIGYVCKAGYVNIRIKLVKKIHIKAHQFIYYIATGKIVKEIDHINGIKNDNRIENLREVTHQQNHFNETKAKGYYLDKRTNRWYSRIQVDGKQINLGYFKFEDEYLARQAYLDAKLIYHII